MQHDQNPADNDISRRDFMATSAVAGAGLVLPMGANLEVGSRGGDLKVALIGCGTQGMKVLMANCLKIPGIKFQAICDIWPYHQRYTAKRLKAYGHKVNAYADYRELLAKEKGLDAAIVATPEWMHADHSIACLQAGLHVYCEKEMSNSLEKARQMVLTSQKTGKLLQIGHQRRSNPRYIHAREKLIGQAHLFGRLTHAYGQWNRGVSPDRGFPKKYPLDQATLEKYGYKDMHQFRNWRWFKKYGGGPIVDLGSHQIDIFSWFFQANPKAVMATGGVDYYKKHEWYDNVMVTYEFDTPEGVARAYYQVLTTTSAKGYFETFMGDEGTLQISEQPSRIRIFAEARINADEKWAKWAKKGYIVKPEVKEEEAVEQPEKDDILAVYESAPVATWLMPIEFNDPFHKPHLENFFNAVRGQGKLNCPGEVGYETAVAVLKVNEAVTAEKKLHFSEKDFKA